MDGDPEPFGNFIQMRVVESKQLLRDGYVVEFKGCHGR
jgi:hypothetical protein